MIDRKDIAAGKVACFDGAASDHDREARAEPRAGGQAVVEILRRKRRRRVEQLQLLQPFFGLLLAAFLLHEHKRAVVPLSDRAAVLGSETYLSWADWQDLAPTKIGSYSEVNLSWKRGSILNKLSEEKTDASAVLRAAARGARQQFSNEADDPLSERISDGFGQMLPDQAQAFLGTVIRCHG